MRKCPDTWPVGGRRLAKLAGSNGDHCDRLASHVEEFNTVAIFQTVDNVMLDDDAHVTGAEAVLWDVGR